MKLKILRGGSIGILSQVVLCGSLLWAGENNTAAQNVAEISLTAAQVQAAGIETSQIALSPLEDRLVTTGEVQANGYTAALITPRIDAIVMDRHVRLGDQVRLGQPLVTLFSVEMARAQNRFINLVEEWKRVQSLGRDIVSPKRRQQTESDYREVVALLKAYGLSEADFEKLRKDKSLDKPGEYILYAPQAGTITADDFLVGALIPSGDPLFELADESTVWIESPLSAREFERVAGARRVIIRGETFQGEAHIVTAHEKLDETTRRRKIRLQVDNPGHLLHPGLFVDVAFVMSGDSQGILLPLEAVVRSPDGDQMVFIRDDDGGFLPREVEVQQTLSGQYQVTGVEVGEEVVVRGAFFIQSELAKSGFSIHNH
ncbi:efflux RND transporter periplasmic adaptor subunit [Paremcibacter congregatus]|uniref:efflux RND transporter periplasmic adaptor subunit n=1 Tax=Paremcibacter congregatus TaxID=2043170 RepID=UPI0030EDE8E9|tara:strand:+ start:1842 stop:2960 length:1119 start_codon:yes stop_codon:yes gene_type:complete